MEDRQWDNRVTVSREINEKSRMSNKFKAKNNILTLE